MDQDMNWAAIEAVLPVAQRPEGYFVMGIPWKFDGVEIWMISATDQSHQVMLFHGAGGDGTEDTRKELFGSAATGRADAVTGTLGVQGRELRVVRHRSVPGGGEGEGGWRDQMMKAFDGANMTVELSPPDSPELIALTYTKQGAVEPVADEDVLEFLEHFRLPGGTLVPQEPAEPASEPVEVPVDEPAQEERDG